MSDPLIYECDNYVVLEPGVSEKILTEEETKLWLENWLNKFKELPIDLQKQRSIKEAAQYLLNTSCNLEIKPGFTIQWFAVRLEPPKN